MKARFAITIALLLVCAAFIFGLSFPEANLPRSPLRDFPGTIGSWKAVDEQTIDPQSMSVLKVDDYVMRTYVNDRGEHIELYVGYFTHQKEGKGIHSPRQCLPGAGWMPLETVTYPLPVDPQGTQTIPVDKFLMGKGETREIFLFWYQGRGRRYSNEYMNRVYLIWDGLTRHRTDGALVRMSSMVARNPEDTLQMMVDFNKLLTPLLPQYIPE